MLKIQDGICSDPVRIIIIEDQDAAAILIERLLRPLTQKFPSVEFVVAPTIKEYKRLKLQIPYFDLHIVDLNLPDSTLLQTIEHAILMQESSPVLILSGHDEQEIRDAAKNAGLEFMSKQDVFCQQPAPFVLKVARLLQFSFSREKNLRRCEDNIKKLRQFLIDHGPSQE